MVINTDHTARYVFVCLLTTLLLLVVVQNAIAHDLNGTWGSSQYEAELSVLGESVKGTFRSLWYPEHALGTIAGDLKENAFVAEWSTPEGEGPGDFSTVLVLSAKGESLTGYRWSEGLYFTGFALHRAVDGEIPTLFDEQMFSGPASSDTSIKRIDDPPDLDGRQGLVGQAIQEAKKLLQQARTQWNKGDLDRAIATLREAKKLDPDNKEIVKTLEIMERQKDEWQSHTPITKNPQPTPQRPSSDDGWAPIGGTGSSTTRDKSGNSEGERSIPKGHSTRYGF